MKKFYFGMETMRVTQNYNGKTSHYNHSHGKPQDYPIDVAGIDGGQSAYFLPVDMRVTAVKGVGNNATNTIWLVSTEKVQTPTFTDYVWLTLTHWNDGSKTSKYQVGDIIKEGEIVGYEGKDGASANHLHVVCGRGTSNNWLENSYGSWVMKGISLKPEEVMYVNKKFTKVVDNGGLNFIDMPVYEYYNKCDEKYKSIVDALKSIGVDSSFSYRKKIAKVNYINNYIGSPKQNTTMLNLLKKGELIKI